MKAVTVTYCGAEAGATFTINGEHGELLATVAIEDPWQYRITYANGRHTLVDNPLHAIDHVWRLYNGRH